MIIFQSPVRLDLYGEAILPYVRYVIPVNHAANLLKELDNKGVVPVSHSGFNSYERRPVGDLNGKRIAIYRHKAWGDQLIATALSREIKRRFPGCKILQFGHAEIEPVWEGNPYIDQFIPGVMHLETLKSCDYHILMESMLECNGEPDQENCYDDMFGFAGIENVPDSMKTPFVAWTSREDANTVRWNEFRASSGFRDYGVLQWESGNPVRSWPLPQRIDFLKRWHEFSSGIPLVVIHKEPIGLQFEGIIDLGGKTKHFRELIPIIKEAGSVICPDSSIGHLAAAFPNTKVVSLWGPFNPMDRVKYYTNHVAITGSCPNLFCHTHLRLPPEPLCKTNKGYIRGMENCAALGFISAESVIKEALLT